MDERRPRENEYITFIVVASNVYASVFETVLSCLKSVYDGTKRRGLCYCCVCPCHRLFPSRTASLMVSGLSTNSPNLKVVQTPPPTASNGNQSTAEDSGV